jgi:DNA-binding transcriptional regulator YdaS (Cro superfamily)
MEKFNSGKWIKAFKANMIAEKDESIKLTDLLHTTKVDDKKPEKVDMKLGAENDLAIEKDKKGNDVYAAGLKEDVDWSTMRLKSNIDQKWRSVEDMKSDLVQWIQASAAAGGVEMLEDIEEEYDSIGEEILKLYKSMDFPRSYR